MAAELHISRLTDFPDVGKPTDGSILRYNAVTKKWDPSVIQSGVDGKSAYQLAVDHGFTGTETEWLASLQGADGADGADGALWVADSGSPSNVEGNNNDFYLDISSGDVHQKINGSWSFVCNIKGPPGVSGTAATITVGTVTTGAAGTPASVTNSGTSSAAVLNFTIPKGDPGDAGTGGGGSGSLTNEVTRSKSLPYSTAGDTNGILYFLGSYYGKSTWTNPHVTGQVTLVMSSSPNSPSTPDYSFINRTADNNNTNPAANSWVGIDLGVGRKLTLKTYTIQNRLSFSTDSLRNWKIQGSNDVASNTVAGFEAATWVDLDTHTSDATIAAANTWYTFNVTGVSTGYRFLRILQTGVNSSGGLHLCFSEIEFYGEATYTETLAVSSDTLTAVVTPANIVSATKTDTQSTTNGPTSWVDVAGLSVTITPTSTASKIKLDAIIGTGNPNASSTLLRLVRNDTPIQIGTPSSSRTAVNGSAWVGDVNSMEEVTISLVDAPATTSPVTYKVQFCAGVAGVAVWINRSSTDPDATYGARSTSTLTAEEKILVVTGGTAVADRYAPNQPMGTVARIYTFESGTEGWTTDVGTLTASGGTLRSTAPAGQSATALEPASAANIADGEMQCVFRRDSGTAGGIVFRATDANNSYMLDITNTDLRLYKRVAGTYTSIAAYTSAGYTTGRDAIVMVRFVASRIDVWFDGAVVITVTDSTFTTGRVGLRSFDGLTNYLRDMRVFSLANGLQPNASGQGSVAGAAYIGAMQQIAEVVLTADASEIVFDGIPQGYRDLRLVGISRSNANDTWDELKIQLNSDTSDSTNYRAAEFFGGFTYGASQPDYGSIANISGDTAPIDAVGSFDVALLGYTKSTQYKVWTGLSHSHRAPTIRYVFSHAGTWMSKSPVSRVRIAPVNGSLLKAGTRVTLYGIGGFNTSAYMTPDNGTTAGTGGLVAAPQPGDAAIGKVLTANNTFALPLAGTITGAAADLTPATIQGLHIWIDASRLSGYADGDPVDSWENIVNGPALTTIRRGSTAPSYKTAIVNGKPIVRMDGTHGLLGWSADVTMTREATFIFAICPRSLALGYGSIITAESGGFGFYVRSSGKLALYTNSINYDATGATTLIAGTFYIITLVIGPKGVTVRVNGTADFSSADVLFTVRSSGLAFRLGDELASGRTLQADWGEFLCYRRAIPSAKYIAIENQLRSKWGTA